MTDQKASILFLQNYQAEAHIDYPAGFNQPTADDFLPLTEFMN